MDTLGPAAFFFIERLSSIAVSIIEKKPQCMSFIERFLFGGSYIRGPTVKRLHLILYQCVSGLNYDLYQTRYLIQWSL